MKHKLYKFLALTNTAVFVMTMGACTKVESKGNLAKEPETTSFSIFDDPSILLTENYIDPFEVESTTRIVETEPETIVTQERLEETTIKENVEETTVKEAVTDPRDNVESRFSSQEELENYLIDIYESSGKSYTDIINEYHEKQLNDYYIYREELYTAAAYMTIIENGYSLNDVALELDYLITARMHPSEITDTDIDALKTLIAISGYEEEKVPYVFQIYEQLALERHKVACLNKSEHVEGMKFIDCEYLNLDDLYQAIITKREEHFSLERF